MCFWKRLMECIWRRKPGIYYIKGLLFPLQILVIRELSKEDNIWLSRLRSGLKPDEDIEVLMKEYKGKEQNPLYETAWI